MNYIRFEQHQQDDQVAAENILDRYRIGAYVDGGDGGAGAGAASP